MRNSFLLLGILVFLNCSSDTQPKPWGYLRLDYPKAIYQRVDNLSKFTFERNNFAQVVVANQSNSQLVYPEMKATLYLNYNTIAHNLDSLLNDAYKLPYKHISKAESIPERVFVNEREKVYGTLFTVVGNAASQFQFFLTDSVTHFLVGSVYFYAKPNYDSIFPAINYLESDIVRLMETLDWKEN
jgi:gliding motility-associated lipoprotein GldD